MIRPLLLITGASFVLALACFAGAAALGGHDVFHRWGAWRHTAWTFDGDHGRWRRYDDGRATDATPATREIAWTGGDRLELDAPADVQYTQAAGPAKLVVTGPKDLVDRLALDGSELTLRDGYGWDAGRLSIVMTAPAVSRFAINGDDTLTIAGYDQDGLDIDVSGRGTAKATGKARRVSLDISGDGDVDLGALASSSAEADISGAGHASIAPTDEANLDISGSGEVDLLTRPPRLNSDVSGAGRIVERPPAPAQPTTPAAPSTPAK
ncbi:MAG TPA: DUF2807 domain-containing protein [Caulobacteraceae bacterium]|nr:DUF2807 domain-containing protein [Caulobacteraceae bacterium]